MNSSSKVLIFGKDGVFGQFWERYFQAMDCEVSGCEALTSLEERFRLVEWADIVIFSVPVDRTVEVIQQVVPSSKVNQLWLNTASEQAPGIEAMKLSKAEYASFRVLCAPPKDLTFKGEIIAVCGRRLELFKPWFEQFLHLSAADIVEVCPNEHDDYERWTTKVNRMMLLLQAMVLAQSGVLPEGLYDLRTKLFGRQMSNISRVLLQSPELDAALLSGKDSPMLMELILHQCRRLERLVSDWDRQPIKDLKLDLREHFGEELLQKFCALTDGKTA